MKSTHLELEDLVLNLGFVSEMGVAVTFSYQNH